jgi:hypothetical protein
MGKYYFAYYIKYTYEWYVCDEHMVPNIYYYAQTSS